MRKITYLLALALIFVFSSQAFSQVKTTSTKKLRPPKLTVELLGDFNLPLQETKGEVADFFQFKNYGVKTGFGGQLNFKLAVDRKKGSMRPFLSLGYAQFQNENTSTAFIDSNNITGGYPLTSGQYGTVPGSSKLFIRNAWAGLGFEYAFTQADKKGRFTPYLDLELDINVLWGLYRQKPTSGIPGGGTENVGTEISFTIKSDTRFGLAVGGGFQYRLSEPFGLNLSFKYRMANLIGKKSERTKSASADPNDENKMNLLDKGDTSLNSLLSKDRNIGYMQLSFGFAFYVGRVK